MEKTQISVGLPGFLGLLFIALKLTGVIDWSWWWVLSPFWGGAVIALVLTAIFVLLAVYQVWRRNGQNRD